MSAEAETIRTYIETGGYEVVTMSDGHASAVPRDEAPVLAALESLLSQKAEAEGDRDEAVTQLERIAAGDYGGYSVAVQAAQDFLTTRTTRLASARAFLSGLPAEQEKP